MPIRHTGDIPASKSVILFLDILGFAQLTLDHPDILGTLGVADPSKGPGIPFEVSVNLVRVFSSFHRIIKAQVQSLEGGPQEPRHVIIFSDSAFMSFQGPHAAFQNAVGLMRSFINAHVPVRMGVGFGAFQVVRFDNQQTASTTVHSSQFLGPAVVNAAWAESKSKLKGMRIAVHPSIQLTPDDRRVIPLPAANAYAACEVNYLHREPDPGPPGSLTPHISQNEVLVKQIRAMAGRVPDSQQIHYFETLAAMQRMSSAFGLGEIPETA